MAKGDSSAVVRIFDRRAVRRHRDRAASRFPECDFLFREVAERLADRLLDVNRSFETGIGLGARGGILRGALAPADRVRWLVETDLSAAMIADSQPACIADEEFLPFAPACADLIVSNLSLHWVNDLPGALAQIRRTLRPDGLFLAAMLGGDTLRELRRAMLEAEESVSGGAAPRVSPFADLADAAALLQRAGFALPVADMDTITVTYADALSLMRDLRGMGETGAAVARPSAFTRRAVLLEAAARYAALYGNGEGRIPATFQVLFLAGWAPHQSQQRPLRPGSAETRLADALDAEERSAGEGTPTDRSR